MRQIFVCFLSCCLYWSQLHYHLPYLDQHCIDSEIMWKRQNWQHYLFKKSTKLAALHSETERFVYLDFWSNRVRAPSVGIRWELMQNCNNFFDDRRFERITQRILKLYVTENFCTIITLLGAYCIPMTRWKCLKPQRRFKGN